MIQTGFVPEQGLRLTALSLADAAKALTKAGGKPIMEANLRADIAAGAPENPDGTLNLIHYTAWLAKEAARGRV